MAKIYIPLLNIILLLSLTFTSAQEIEWQNTIGGISNDELKSIQQTVDGGYILGGNSYSGISGDKTVFGVGLLDYWIVKTDSLGIIQWQNVYGGNVEDYMSSIQLTSDGGYILGGYSKSIISGNKTEGNLGGYDYWIIKIDSIGNIQWQNTIGGDADDRLTSIEQTSDGGYVLGGWSASNILGDKTENSLGGNDYWIIKCDSLGSIQWQNTIGGNFDDVLYEVHQTADGGYILGGYSNSNIAGDKTENNLGSIDYWIVKIDIAGNIQWQNTLGGTSYEELKSIQQTSDGGYILGGGSSSDISGDKTKNSFGGMDCWIIKTDGLGNILWQKTIGGNGLDALNSIKQTVDGGYVLAVKSNSSFSGYKAENGLGDFDYWIIKTDSMGNIQRQNTIGGDFDDNLYAIQQTSDDGYILAGTSASNIFGDKTENRIGSYDYWIVKLTARYNLITGLVFADFNSNSVKDVGEPPIVNCKITEQNTNRFAFPNQNGEYSLTFLNKGFFLVDPQPVIWYSPTPVTHADYFLGYLQTDSLNDFAFQPQGTFEDVCITITPLGNFRSGFTASYIINYGNYGNTTVAPTVYFYPYNNVTYLSASLSPNNITSDSVVWNLPALTPFQTGSIVVTVYVNLGLPIGTLINSSAHIEPYLTDDNPSCNNSNWEVYTTGSYDPNDIIVSDKVLTTTKLITSPWLDYTIRFQNTGNDTAFMVNISNQIDTLKYKLETIEFVNSSHPVEMNWINYQQNMEFKYENILLPDSNTNEPLSHGFVRYRIQPRTNIQVGDSAINYAAIYFDFNDPVFTNRAKTTIILPTGISSEATAIGNLQVFPNPTEKILNISGIHLENGKAQLRLTDIYGKLILEKTITSVITTLETNNLSSGIYLIQSGELRATFVKQ